jgi:hypothetical protein
MILGSRCATRTGGFRLWRRQTLVGNGHRAPHPQQRLRLPGRDGLRRGPAGYTIREVPIEFPDRKAGESKMNVGIQLEARGAVFEVRRRHRRPDAGGPRGGG